MKKLLLIGFSILGLTAIHAQNNAGDFTLAPQIGVAFSTYAPSDRNYSYDARTSASAGAILEYYLNDRWSLRSGLLYDAMGAQDGYDNIDKLNYLAIPLNANWHFGKNRNWYLNFGPSLAFLMSAESELSNGSTIDIDNYIKGMDIGIGLGIGYKFDIDDNFQLFVDYQGYGGFVDVAEDGILPYGIRNSRSSFNFGGIFKL